MGSVIGVSLPCHERTAGSHSNPPRPWCQTVGDERRPSRSGVAMKALCPSNLGRNITTELATILRPQVGRAKQAEFLPISSVPGLASRAHSPGGSRLPEGPLGALRPQVAPTEEGRS